MSGMSLNQLCHAGQIEHVFKLFKIITMLNLETFEKAHKANYTLRHALCSAA